MITNEVTVHTEQPLTSLLCGRSPVIVNRRIIRKKEPAVQEIDKIDLSAFPPEITTYRKRSRSAVRTRRRLPEEKIPMTRYKKIKNEEPLIQKVTTNLDTYTDNHRRKAIQIHQDWEERYMRPFLSTMKHKLNGYDYDDFVTTRTRATTALGTRSPYNALNDVEAASLPYVRIPLSSCEDRIHKFQRHTATENRLTDFVLRSQGINTEKPPLKERNTVDVEAWKILPETRFYDPSTTTRKKGRRPYREILNSTVNRQMDQYE
ncbi:hypothetical protein TRFO_36332 [Tritrichomonas foetus]|uniref:Uncharacterized protein n=1 Tax=Tritrichomonas foetus TaxID=1144522 RepID=A0A1J4JIU5_9EUKA|nr:hypothetical protein TRFO_36332 [Tritrichomonas foetus]|eukprot:OHS97469.1 hypothetical protein TRFO_36332 [Tritrichomonas foetus]